ncbi:hypothetical protein RNJ44_01297 [Nakaseomyces bracarensis]|uniref:PWWP domain-containing protein n=1 Tax=Nakaseomyces bracarensis TaxID=273131 RepID=A0ABR4NRI0_9SACH
MENQLKTGDLVLCKVGSFPPWPAVVFPQRLLRKDVYKKKKNNCVAVCFLNDVTYYWEQPHRLKPLTKEIINDYFSRSHKTSSQRDLLEAYKQADSFEDFRSFVEERFSEEDRTDELRNEESQNGPLTAGEDPFWSEIKSNNKRTHSESSTSQENGKNTKKRRKSSTTTVKDSKLAKNDIAKQNNGEKKKNNKLDRNRREEISLLFRRRIQKNLIQRDGPPTDMEIKESHKLLNKIKENLNNKPPFFDLDTLRTSKLHKLFKAIVNVEELKEFHPICKEILIHWSNMITTLKVEKAQKLNKSNVSENKTIPIDGESDVTSKELENGTQ